MVILIVLFFVTIRGRLTKRSDSRGTDNSAGTYESSSSLRFSSSSTDNPANESPVPENTQSSHSRGFHDIPPLTGALRAAGRTFSFGGRLSKQLSSSTPQPQPSDPSRNKTMTATSATPPKLLDTDLNLGKDNDFQSMLDNFEKPSHSQAQEPHSVDDLTDPVWVINPLLFFNIHANNTIDELQAFRSAFQTTEKPSRPAPINTDRSKEVEPSPYSWDSRNSEEGLLSTSDPGQEDSLMAQTNPMPINEGRKSVPPITSTPPATTSHRALERPRTGTDNGLRRSLVFPGKRTSTPVEDEDARLIMESVYSSKRNSQLPFTANHEDESLFGHANTTEPAPLRVHKSPGPSECEPDLSIADNARIAAHYEHNLPKSTSPANKVMTPSQFEHYRQQQELRRSNTDASKSEYSAESDYDEEDEVEKVREAERQRRKQEAHLSVYRQQMMKVTGQQQSSTSVTSLRPELDFVSSSTPNLTVQLSNAGNRSGSGKSTDGDEDEEIPLGILAAHGFPSKNRPPAHLSSSKSIPNLRASPKAPGSSSGSAYGDHDAANRGSLPAFAKNLPRDPYYGASLVNPSNRESLAMGGGSVHGHPSSALPPGGLVGVIATEELSRAIRRGSPKTQAVFDHGGGTMMPGGPPHPGSGIPRPYSMMSPNPSSAPAPQQQISATEQAQINLSQQMSHMMQMQMQWMQQMMQMQGGQSSIQPPPQMPMGAPLPTATNPNAKPASASAIGAWNYATVGPQGHQRALSMLDPNASPRLNGTSVPYASGGVNRPGTPAGQGYAPSIAPSERTNIGAAPRYRPVSTLQPDQGPFLAPPVSKPWNDENQRSSISLSKPSTPTVVVRPISSSGASVTAGKPRQTAAADDDEDDDEGWAEMMKKREKKKSNWKTKRETSNLGDLLNAVH